MIELGAASEECVDNGAIAPIVQPRQLVPQRRAKLAAARRQRGAARRQVALRIEVADGGRVGVLQVDGAGDASASASEEGHAQLGVRLREARARREHRHRIGGRWCDTNPLAVLVIFISRMYSSSAHPYLQDNSWASITLAFRPAALFDECCASARKARACRRRRSTGQSHRPPRRRRASTWATSPRRISSLVRASPTSRSSRWRSAADSAGSVRRSAASLPPSPRTPRSSSRDPQEPLSHHMVACSTYRSAWAFWEGTLALCGEAMRVRP